MNLNELSSSRFLSSGTEYNVAFKNDVSEVKPSRARNTRVAMRVLPDGSGVAARQLPSEERRGIKKQAHR